MGRRKSHLIRPLTAPELRVTLSVNCAVPAAQLGSPLFSGGRRFRLRTFGFVALAFQAQGTPDSGPGGVRFRQAHRGCQLALEERPADPAPLLRRFLGHHPLQDLAVPRAPSATPARSCRSSARAPSSPRCSRSAPASRRARSSGSSRRATPSSTRSCAQRAAPRRRSQAGRRLPPRPTLRSLDAVDRALLRATSAEVGKLEKRVPFLATTASITPFIGLFGTVWGSSTRSSTSARRVDQPERRRARHRRSADRDRRGSVRRGAGGVLLQRLHQPGEGVRDRDGRFLARVPEHLGAELHLDDAEGASRSDSTCRRFSRRSRADARARRRACPPRSPRSTSSRWSTSCWCC